MTDLQTRRTGGAHLIELTVEPFVVATADVTPLIRSSASRRSLLMSSVDSSSSSSSPWAATIVARVDCAGMTSMLRVVVEEAVVDDIETEGLQMEKRQKFLMRRNFAVRLRVEP